MKIVLVNNMLIMGGIEKCVISFAKEFSKENEIFYLYLVDRALDNDMKEEINQYAKVIYQGDLEKISCDVCIWCNLYFDYSKLKPKILSKKNIAWIHSMPRILPNCLLDNQEFVNDMDEFICVSEGVKNNLNISKEGKVIHNFISDDIYNLASEFNPFEECTSELKLVTACRLSKDKGFKRIKLMADALDEKNVNYKWLIVGNGRTAQKEIIEYFTNNKSVEFVGKKLNPFPYFKNADYNVLLSDDESWSNVITEAKILKVPCIITNFQTSTEQIQNGYNGLIIDKNLMNYNDVVDEAIKRKEIFKMNLQDFKYENEVDKWNEILYT